MAALERSLLVEGSSFPAQAGTRLTDTPQGRLLIVADGINVGRDPLPGLVGLGLVQSTRGYDPMRLTHYRAGWVNSEGWPEPTWPLVISEDNVWDRERLREDLIEPWKVVTRQGVPVHVGEWGVFHHTPHDVALAYMEDLLTLWDEAGWGWALWNFRGPFGILDSGREDVRDRPRRREHPPETDVPAGDLDRLSLLQRW